MAGRIARQGQLLALLFLTVAAFSPGKIYAQDVIVFPPSTAAAASAPLPLDDTPAATADTTTPLTTTLQPIPTLLTPAVAQDAAVPANKLDANPLQCTTDADCVVVSDGCTAMTVVGKNHALNWQAKQPPHDANCKSVFQTTQAASALTAVCRSNLCGLLNTKAKQQ
jgi:hypothetical protein